MFGCGATKCDGPQDSFNCSPWCKAMRDLIVLGALFAASCGRLAVAAESGPPLEGTVPLTLEGDLAEQMIAGVDRFLLTELENSIAKREAYWRRDTTSAE